MSNVTITRIPRARRNRDFAVQMIALMAGITRKYLGDLELQTAARRFHSLPEMFEFLQRRIEFVNDGDVLYGNETVPPEGLEQIRSPRRTVLEGWPGDCDDLTVAAGTLLKILGYRVKYRAVAWRSPDFTHVLAVIVDPHRGEIPFDLTMQQIGEQRRPMRTLDIEV